MNPDRFGSQIERSDGQTEDAKETPTFLEDIRKWAHNRVLATVLLVGMAGAAGCNMPRDTKQDQQIENPEKDCAPFAIYFTNALYYSNSNELAGFTLNYKVPEGEEFKNVTIRVLDKDDNVIYEDVRDLAPGDGRIQFLDKDVPGAANASAVESVVEGKVVSRSADFTQFDDDDDPIGI